MNKFDQFTKVKAIIVSCETEPQLKACFKIFERFTNLHSDTLLSSKLLDTLEQQIEDLELSPTTFDCLSRSGNNRIFEGWVIDWGDDVDFLASNAEELTLSGENIHD